MIIKRTKLIVMYLMPWLDFLHSTGNGLVFMCLRISLKNKPKLRTAYAFCQMVSGVMPLFMSSLSLPLGTTQILTSSAFLSAKTPSTYISEGGSWWTACI